jgi:hypothetical protein
MMPQNVLTPSTTPSRHVVWIVTWSCLVSLTMGFAAPPLPTLNTKATTMTTSTATVARRHPATPFVLYVKKASKSKVDPSTSANGGGGAGFGTASASKKTSSLANKLQGKVRTVSGFSGSGTKPLRQAANTFDDIRKTHGKEACFDIYCKSPLDDPYRLWFVGKIAVVPNTGATPDQAVLSQKRIILEYAKRELRPQNLGLPKYADTLELWLAPGDSELECVQNKISLKKVEGSLTDLLLLDDKDFSLDHVGFNPEIYVGDEREQGGLRIVRDNNGNPMKPVFEVNESA